MVGIFGEVQNGAPVRDFGPPPRLSAPLRPMCGRETASGGPGSCARRPHRGGGAQVDEAWKENYNKSMSKLRISAEWMFEDMGHHWHRLHQTKTHRMYCMNRDLQLWRPD